MSREQNATAAESSMELPEAANALQLPQPSLPTGCVDSEALPWVDQGPGVEMKIIRAAEHTGTWVVLNRFQPGVVLPTHRHSSCVTAYTISGRWRYMEYDFIAKPGSVIFEPACTAHTLCVPEEETEPAVVFFVIEGGLTHIGPDGKIWDISDALTERQRYHDLAKEQGKTIPDGLILG